MYAEGTDFYRLNDGSGPYTTIGGARAARIQFNAQDVRCRREVRPLHIQKLEAVDVHDELTDDCYGCQLEWVDVDE